MYSRHTQSSASGKALMPDRNLREKREGVNKSIFEEKQVNQAIGTEQELKIPLLSGERLSCSLRKAKIRDFTWHQLSVTRDENL